MRRREVCRTLELSGETLASGLGINDLGEVTGQSRTLDGDSHAFLYDATGMHDLGSLGGEALGVAINNHGTVVGYSYLDISSTVRHAFVYTEGSLFDLNALIDPELGVGADECLRCQ